MVNLFALIFGTLCRDCGERYRADVCGPCFARRVVRAERCDSRVIAHPETDWNERIAFAAENRWPAKVGRKKTALRAVQ